MFSDVKVGDVVIRMLAGVVRMPLPVSEITEERIITPTGYQFDRATGAEIDEDLNWGPPPLMTGSFLTKE